MIRKTLLLLLILLTPALGQVSVSASQKGDKILVTLFNRGRQKVAYVPPQDTLAHGWTIIVKGPNGSFHPAVKPGAILPLKLEHFQVLRKGQRRSVEFPLAGFVNQEMTRLVDHPGDYEAHLTYELNYQPMPAVPAEILSKTVRKFPVRIR